MFIARQPIFNRFMKVYGYELLYRDSETACAFGNASAAKATATVLGGLFELGIHQISDDKKAFVNFDHDFLMSDTLELIEEDQMVVEVMEDVSIDPALIERLKYLKKRGYQIALDDFAEDYAAFPLVPLSDIIKYDLRLTPLDCIHLEVKKALKEGKTLLAEKVETREEFEMAKAMGFSLFQGYFFEKPAIIGRSNTKKSVKMNYIKIINELGRPEPSFTELAKVIQTDVNLSYRLLRVIRQNDKKDDLIFSIKKYLVFMGFRRIERWINILMLQDLGTDKPLELTRLSLIRSHFAGLIAQHSAFKSRFNEVHGMLLFSTLDALLDQTMEEALEGITLTDDMKEALTTGQGALAPLLDLVLNYEKGQWEEVNCLCEKVGIDEDRLSRDYLDALKSCENIMQLTKLDE